MHVVITAAGQSQRFGGGNKLLQPLCGRPVLGWTLAAFEACRQVDAVYVTAPAEDEALYRTLLVDFAPRTGREVVVGGEHRQASIHHALQRLAQAPPELVAVHDGARPLLSPALVEALREACRTSGHGVVPGAPVSDTIKRIEGAFVQATVDRASLVAVQTPQVFPWRVLWSAHERAAAEGFVGTDDASLVERYGATVSVVRGEPWNIKVTLPHDLWLAEQWLKRKT
ncbi:MAG TPA: 2-C-methyl-D-erythritol 4-phosphate cytidylyltransferase [Candidatus Xenobia bacterium]